MRNLCETVRTIIFIIYIMKSIKSIQEAFIVTLFIAIVLSGCSHSVTPVTDANTAQLPIITINGFPEGGSIEKNNLTSQTTINADFGMSITISGSAKTPDGVRDFSIQIFRNEKLIYKATTNSSPDASGKVPDELSILGTNNNGEIGNTPMKFIMDEVTEIKVTASNYAGITKSFSLLYVPVAASQRGKNIIQNVTLEKNVTLNIFTASFPNILANATLVALNGGSTDIYLLLPSNGNILDCNDPDATIRLPAFGNLQSNQYLALFGNVNPSLPISLKACALGSSANSNQVYLTVTYRLN